MDYKVNFDLVIDNMSEDEALFFDQKDFETEITKFVDDYFRNLKELIEYLNSV